MKIAANDLKRQYSLYAEEYESAALTCLRSGWYVMGPMLQNFEQKWAEYVGTQYCVGVASGLDALWMAFRLLGIGTGDEVIVAANAYIACVMGITINGAIPVFVEPDQYFQIDSEKIEEKITSKTKAILAVHLFGQSCNMTEVMNIAKQYSLKVVEDCAQSHGNHWMDQRTGSFGDISCFSFYPTKGCGAFGDGGCIVTNDADLAKNAKILRNYGSDKKYHNKIVGSNSRLDELQAALLTVKLAHLDELNAQRCQLADRYSREIKNSSINMPKIRMGADSTWHQYVLRVRQRARFIDFLQQYGVETMIHYPVPPHLSEAYQHLGYKKGDFPITEEQAEEVVSIPIYNGMTQIEQSYVIDVINAYENC